MARLSPLNQLGLVLMLALVAIPAQGAFIVRISDLQYSPTPPNPIKVVGTVTSESPLKLSDGRADITVVGIAGNAGDMMVVQGNWDGTVLTVDPAVPPEGYTTTPAVTQIVYVPAGFFRMGNSGVGDDALHGRSDESPQHSVDLSGYWIGKYDVTRGEYRQFMGAGGYSNSAYWSADGWAWRKGNNRTQPYFWDAVQNWGTGNFTQDDSFPVVGVSFYEAEAYCNWAGGHLPTEAQWEKAARWDAAADHPNVYPWGDTWDAENCNNSEDTNPAGGGYEAYQTSPVGAYPAGASPYGCEDMEGNVNQWCQDWYDGTYYSQTPAGSWVDPQGPASSPYDSRVLRGGSWFYGLGYIFRCAARPYDSPGSSYNYYGFRMAR